MNRMLIYTFTSRDLGSGSQRNIASLHCLSCQVGSLFLTKMAKLSYTIFFFIALLVISAAPMVPLADAQKRCQVVLDPNKCDLLTCRQQCFTKYGGSGICNPVRGGAAYHCLCIYNC